ncbi:hypothetical protein HGH93_12040 [Chitinophaga polysaccharea]|uniref:hypothetical protein n=1 Tax=Chitinophaga polysaccharea TaxID=1293035 RepID=UPI001455666A|nr:hypothetical protein [Chitinophaga polysaccharea]NLR58837.1 hypothetical protein [Chitinophaga polysaccharea]
MNIRKTHCNCRVKQRHSAFKATGKQTFPNSIISYIVVHTTGTKPGMLLTDVDALPYHYLVTKGGRLISLKPVQVKDGTIEIALAGGMDKAGNRVDNRSELQNETLFSTLILLSERYPQAKIVGADKVYIYPYANPGFDLSQWIASYIPAILNAA